MVAGQIAPSPLQRVPWKRPSLRMFKFSLDFVRLTLAGFLLVVIRQRMFMQIHIFTNAIEETGIYFTLWYRRSTLRY